MDLWSGEKGVKSGTTFVLASFVNLQIFTKLVNTNAIE